MYLPWIVGLVSIVPGLGFWLISQRRRGIGAMILVVGSFIIYYLAQRFSWWQPLVQFFRYVAFTLWIGQMVFAADTARLINQRSKNRSNAARKSITMPKPPPGLSRNQRAIYRTRELVRDQLSPDDHLVAAIDGNYLAERKDGISIQFPMRTRFIGLTEENLLLIDLDLLGDPMLVERLHLESVINAVFKKGIVTDTLKIDLKDGKKIEMKVSFQLREETILIVQELYKNRPVWFDLKI
jgi:predicted DNA-binding antitoxin AbrB/MazE fold protein